MLMSETIEGLMNKFLKWKEAFENKAYKVFIGITKVMACGNITQDGSSKSGICS